MPYLRSILCLILFAGTLHAGDWPQWLGPNRNGSTEEVVKPWKGNLKILWRQKVGEGHSSPVVAKGIVYLHTRKGNEEKELLSAYDGKSGKLIWATPYKRRAYKGLFGNGPRATPTVAYDRVYTSGITGILTCFDVKNGQVLWQVDTLKQFKAPMLFFGMSWSPLVEGNRVFMNVGGKGASIVAFDAAGGGVLWKTLDDKASYSSPIAIGKGIERHAVFLTAGGLVGVALRDGSVFWQHKIVDRLAESSTTPVLSGKTIIGSTITRGAVGLTLDTTGQIPRAKKTWTNGKLTCYFATPVPVGKQLYLVTGTTPPAFLISATLRCVDTATGKELWNRKNVGKYHASLMRTGDGKLLLLEEAGNLVLVDPHPKGYRELARAKICGSTWAHAAISNGKLYIRDRRELICVALPK